MVGLYLNPPDNAAVFCEDEKSSIPALGRTQPGLPMKKGRAGTMTHDYKRHGTSTLVKEKQACHAAFHSGQLIMAKPVELLFSLVTEKAIKRGVFGSVKELEAKLMQFIDQLNKNPEPFVCQHHRERWYARAG